MMSFTVPNMYPCDLMTEVGEFVNVTGRLTVNTQTAYNWQDNNSSKNKHISFYLHSVSFYIKNDIYVCTVREIFSRFIKMYLLGSSKIPQTAYNCSCFRSGHHCLYEPYDIEDMWTALHPRHRPCLSLLSVEPGTSV